VKRFVLPPDCTGEGEIALTGKDFHYLCRVRRLKAGDSVPAMTTDGTRFQLLVVERDAKACRALVFPEPADNQPWAEEPAPIELYQAVPKGRVFDDVVRRCVEAGVTKIFPVYTDFTVAGAQPENAERHRREERLRRIARSAAEQCGAVKLPEIAPAVELTHIPSFDSNEDAAFFLHQEPLAEQSLHGYLVSTVRKVVLAVGPEGGFSPRELRLLEQKGFCPVYLGPQVLRTENAAFFAVAAIRVLLLERESWKMRNSQT
jgi:16S rRNA (uracil1498-N3)-methyltransferase